MAGFCSSSFERLRPLSQSPEGKLLPCRPVQAGRTHDRSANVTAEAQIKSPLCRTSERVYHDAGAVVEVVEVACCTQIQCAWPICRKQVANIAKQHWGRAQYCILQHTIISVMVLMINAKWSRACRSLPTVKGPWQKGPPHLLC